MSASAIRRVVIDVVVLLVGIGLGASVVISRDPPPQPIPATRAVRVEFTGCLVWLERADKAPAGPVVFRVPLEMARPLDAEKGGR